MIKRIVSIAIFVTGTAFLATQALAFSPLLPFGGKITAIVPGAICSDAKTPFTIMPSGIVPAGPYGGTASALIGFPTEVIMPGVWVLGLYLPTPLPICFTTTVPPVPVFAMPVYVIGTSKAPSL